MNAPQAQEPQGAVQSGGEAGSAPGGWSGWRGFVVERRVRESDTIVSFHLRPADGGPVPPHRPGQYLTLLAEVPGKGGLKRTYTVSCAPHGESYRISVKREPEGTVSRWLHDTVSEGTVLKVAPPAGEFVLPAEPERPVVLVSGGVGLTPMVSMLEHIAHHQPGLETHYVHVTTDGSTHAMGEHVRGLAEGRPNIAVTTFYSRPRPQDVPGQGFDEAGRLGPDWLRAHTPMAEADYFLCGPIPFLRDLVSGLAEAGVPAGRIHYEFFGSMDRLLEAWPEALDLAPGAAAPAAAGPRGGSEPAAISRHDIAEALLNAQSDAVVVSDREGFIVLWNPGAERIFGFTEAEAMGQSLDIIIPEGLRGRHWEGYRETVATGQSRYGAGDLLSVPGLHKDGHRISLEFTIVLLKDGAGVVTGMASVLRDVTAHFEQMKSLRKKVAELEGRG
ncbi:PAS domain S-box protein [Azospirillum sp. SYSU D00513]|uniref:PAS domain S-box protein n=1 Tax=Azospirillum sp. SYSU D00513 TaxID=2812561 RepID=UPI0032B42238